MGKRITQEEFIEKARKIHGDKYDYSMVNYVGCNDEVIIICPEHGEFKQVANYHLSGNGCKKCFNEHKRGKARQLTTEEFIKRAREIHGDKYDYSKVEYKDSHTKVCIVCPKHGDFFITPNKHLNGRGCNKCGNLKKGQTHRLTNEIFIKKAIKVHGNKYDYSKVDLERRDNEGRVCIICPVHGEFWQKPSHHLSGCGCHMCNEWEMEYSIKKALMENGILFEQQKKFPWLKRKTNLKIDFYLPDYNIGIECQGAQHFRSVDYFGGESTFRDIKERDLIKKHLCEEKGIKLLYFTRVKVETPNNFIYSEDELIKAIKENSNGY